MEDGRGRLAAYVPRLVFRERQPTAQHWTADGSLLFCDVSGFTRLSEKLARQGKAGAEELVVNLNRVFTALLSATDDGGDVLKFSGDAMVIFFDGPDHPLRAAHAAHGMRRALTEVGSIVTSQGRVRLRMSTGVHSGTFEFFLCGHDHLELLATGPGVSSTVRMESSAEAGQILLSRSTASALPPAVLGAPSGDGVLLRRAPTLPPIAGSRRQVLSDEATGHFVPRILRDRLGVNGSEAEHRLVTVAFLQFRETDELLERHGPAHVFERLQALTVAVQDAARRYEVCLLATDIDADGGKFMLAAGAPLASEDDEGRMLRACLDILDVDVGLPVRIGVNRGHLFGGDVGAPFRRTWSTMGDVTNLAARIMGKAPVGSVLAHRSVIEHATERFHARAVPPFMVKGKSAPVDASIVEGRREDDEVVHLPLVGRTTELGVLADGLASSTDGQGVVVEFVGDPGAGASRLMHEFLGELDTPRVLSLACDPYDRSSPFSAARALLRDALGIPRDATPEDAGARLLARVRDLAPDLEPLASLMGPVIDAALPPAAAVDELADQFRLARTHTIATRLLAAAVPEAVICLDDASSMDEASAQLLADALRRTRDRRWLVVICRRREEQGLHAGLGYRAQVHPLEPLDAEEARELVRTATRSDPLPARDVEAVVDRGAGNPLFLLELVAALRDGHGSLPPSVESVVASRIDRLSIQDRRALRDLAVLGTTIPPDLLDGVLSTDGVRSTDTDRWHRVAAFVTRRSDGTLAFRSGLHRDTAYEGLTFSRRRDLHRRAGLWLEHVDRVTAGTPAALAHHFHAAQEWDRVWTWARRAGNQARAVHAHAEAAEAYRRALDAARRLPGIPPDDVREVAEGMGDATELIGDYEAARSAYAVAARQANGCADVRARLMRKQGVVQERVGRYPSALRWYSRGLNAAQDVLDAAARSGLRAELANAYAGVRFRQGRLQECARWCHQALEDGASSGRTDVLAHAYYLLEAAFGMLGDPRADEVRGLSLPLYETAGDLLGQGNVLNNLGITAYYAGRWDEALDLYARSREAFARVGDDVAAATAANNIGEILSDQGHLEPAEDLFREALATWRSVDYPLGVALAISNLGRLALRRGDPHTAGADLDEALRRFCELGSTSFVLETRARQVDVLLAAGRADEALQEAVRVRAAAERDGAGLVAVTATRLEGLALVATGQPRRGLLRLEEAVTTARTCGGDHELALALAAVVDHDPTCSPEVAEEERRLRASLGVIARPAPCRIDLTDPPVALVPPGRG